MYNLKELQEIINNEFNNLDFKQDPVELYEPIEYILSIGGKHLRPTLVLMACNLFSDTVNQAIKPALGIDIFHNFTLLHDDIMDNASIRRNHSTVHTKWNVNVAILSGDAMCIKAYEYLAECDPYILKVILNIFNRTALKVCEGQQYDMNFENAQKITEKEYLKMIELKTSVLIASCLKIGALIGGAKEKEAQLLYEFGKNIGMAFQLQDDLLDVYGDSKVFGKKIGGDIISNKKTFLLITALELAKGSTLAELKNQINAIEFKPEKKIKAVRNIYDKLAAKKITEKNINEFFEFAFKFLDKVNIDEKRKTELKKFTKKIIHRVK